MLDIDKLYSLLRRCALSCALLLALLPTVSINAQAQSSDWTYTMRPADTLWSLCKRFAFYENCWRELGDYNAIPKETAIPVGTKIRMPLEWIQAPLEAARIAHLSGEVSVIRENLAVANLAAGDSLEIGDRIILAQGELVVEFSDGSQLMLEPNSELQIDAMSAIKQTRQSDIQLSLPKGSARIKVREAEPRNRFRIRTLTGVAAVRGTAFRVRNDDVEQVTRTEVLEGKVEYSAVGQTVAIDSGFASLTVLGEAPMEPVELLPAPTWLPQCDIPELVEWEANQDADYYVLELMDELEGGVALGAVLARYESDKSYHEFENLDDGCYRLRVKGVEDGFYGLDSERRYCYEEQVSAPYVKLAELDDSSLTVLLEPISGVGEYILEFSADSRFSTVTAEAVVGEPVYRLQFAEGEQDNYRYVRAQARSTSGKLSAQSDSEEVQQERGSGAFWVMLAVLAAFALL